MSLSSTLSRFRERLDSSATSVENVALYVGTGAFIVVGFIAVFYVGFNDMPIAGPGSLGQFVAYASAVAAVVAFVFGRQFSLKDDFIPGIRGAKRHWALRLLDLAAVAFAHAIICLLLWVVVADALERAFQGAVVYSLPAIVLAGVAAALSAYFVFLSSVHLNPLMLSAVLAVFLVVGAFASMLTAQDPFWWKENLSALGITNDLSAFAFNITLIIGGAIVTTIARYATSDLERVDRAETRGIHVVRIALVIVGVCLACVGIFPVNEFLLIHNTVATGMTVVFAALVIALPKLLPSVPRAFVVLGWAFMAAIALVAVFFAVGYYNLTAVELVAAVLIFSWIIVFIRTTSAMAADEPKVDVDRSSLPESAIS